MKANVIGKLDKENGVERAVQTGSWLNGSTAKKNDIVSAIKQCACLFGKACYYIIAPHDNGLPLNNPEHDLVRLGWAEKWPNDSLFKNG